MKRQWKRAGPRTYRFDCDVANGMIFGSALPLNMWAYGVWSNKRSLEGIAASLASARLRANNEIDRLLAEKEAGAA